jgi:excinuclease ABC subunit C
MIQIPKQNNSFKVFTKDLSEKSGVYKFINKEKEIIYIGKAKNIKKRVLSYFGYSKKRKKRILQLITESKYLDLTLTNSELEALLLEQHLIKKIKPKFNVQFKDDKGYPWIKIDTSKTYPGAKSFLGKKGDSDKYFGPYPSSYAVRDALKLIQKIFQIRNCSDSFFKGRTRPCIQHEIGRCSAPCVGLIEKKEYEKNVKSTELLLSGKSEELISGYYELMEKLSKKKLYEKAAQYRDKISALRDLQRSQSISGFTKERDAILILKNSGQTRIGITHVSQGWLTGHENFIQKHFHIEGGELESFIAMHYLDDIFCPETIVLDSPIKDRAILEKGLSDFHKKTIKIVTTPKKKDKGLLEICRTNTEFAFKNIKNKKDNTLAFKALKDDLSILKDIEVIESFDVSHHSSKAAVGSCVVYNKSGKDNSKYRLFNISIDNSGNDIGSMVEVIKRRLTQYNEWPNLIVIDGGWAHLSAVHDLLKSMGVRDINLISISKGARRKSLFDTVHTTDGRKRSIKRDSIAHLFLQEVRDETHRFAISNQKKKQIKLSLRSSLDEIIGIGEVKKNLLLRHFGSLEQIERASIEDLNSVPKIGLKSAELVYNLLH